MKTAVIYARYSSDRQTEQSIEGQLRVCNDYAARNDIVVVDTYIDRAMTGTNDKRAAFQRMLRDSAKRACIITALFSVSVGNNSSNSADCSSVKYSLSNL